jgi:hypothetical protein
MQQQINTEQQISGQNTVTRKKYVNFRQFIDGNFFVQDSIKKQTLYILFLVLLSVIYIHNKYRTEALMVNILKSQKEVKELRDRSIDYASELMSLSRESEVIRMIETKKLNLKELKSPPEKIVIKRNN